MGKCHQRRLILSQCYLVLKNQSKATAFMRWRKSGVLPAKSGIWPEKRLYRALTPEFFRKWKWKSSASV